jgi:hypothetical protein
MQVVGFINRFDFFSKGDKAGAQLLGNNREDKSQLQVDKNAKIMDLLCG